MSFCLFAKASILKKLICSFNDSQPLIYTNKNEYLANKKDLFIAKIFNYRFILTLSYQGQYNA